MPEPNYNEGEPPGVFAFILGMIVIVIVLALLKGCLGW